MKLSITDPLNIYPILDKTLYMTTRYASKNEPQSGDKIQIYYRNTPEKTCYNCLNSKEVRGVECPYYDSKNHNKNKNMSDAMFNEHKRQSGSCKCIHHVNFLGDAVVTSVDHYDNYFLIPNLLLWANAQGFKTPLEAKECLTKKLGNVWDKSQLTVLSWDLKRNKK